MIEFAKSDNQVEIKYEMTIPTEPFGNLKPCLKMKCKACDIEQALLFLRSRLNKERNNIKQVLKNNQVQNNV